MIDTEHAEENGEARRTSSDHGATQVSMPTPSPSFGVVDGEDAVRRAAISTTRVVLRVSASLRALRVNLLIC